jgi:hypothetical protein
MPEPTDPLSIALAERFPAVPLESVVRCVWDARDAVEFAGVEESEREALVERLAQAHVEELLPFYDETAASE